MSSWAPRHHFLTHFDGQLASTPHGYAFMHRHALFTEIFAVLRAPRPSIEAMLVVCAIYMCMYMPAAEGKILLLML